jgi:tellurite resistance-related uncharacterized protein
MTERPWVLTPEGRAEKLGVLLDCVRCDRREMPAGHVAYQRTPAFTNESVPRALLARHDTKPGVWALLHVTRGALEFVELEPGAERRQRVGAGERAVIRPEVEHRVVLAGDVEFHVEFWRASSERAGGPPS